MTNHSAPLDISRDKYTWHSEFIELAAHDLQSPLRKLSVLTERLISKYNNVPGIEVQSYLTRINSCISDMRSLIDGFSSLVSITPTSMNYLACDTGSIVKKVVQDMAPVIQQKQVTVSVSPMPVLYADKTQLEILFKKILENAVLFGKEETQPRIDITSKPLTPADQDKFNLAPGVVYHQLQVEDNGIGFDQEYAEKIFWPLVRLNGKSSFPGNGLGLALCEKIVANHQGILYAEGIENKGAKFTIILPEKI